MASGKYLFTSEAVSMGHPDKLADQISDGVLDALFAQDPNSRVACETMVKTGMVIVADGTEAAARRLERVLTNDPGTGVMRHADAGYDIAQDCAREQGLVLPMAAGR